MTQTLQIHAKKIFHHTLEKTKNSMLKQRINEWCTVLKKLFFLSLPQIYVSLRYYLSFFLQQMTMMPFFTLSNKNPREMTIQKLYADYRSDL